MTKTILETEAAERRAAAERAIARYPVLKQDEIADVVRYIRKDASALDRAAIASNPDLHDRYRELCRDHHLDGLRPIEMMIVAGSVISLMVLVVGFYLLKGG